MSSNLFVAEDEDVLDSPAMEQYEDLNTGFEFSDQNSVDDDPVILSIPIFHSGLPDRQSQSIHVLQFTGRPLSRPFSDTIPRVLMKSASRVIDFQHPMNTSKHYDETRCEDLGARVNKTSHQGVLTPSDGELYVGKITEKDELVRLVLVPLDGTAQLKPAFGYLDDMDMRAAQSKKDEAQLHAAKSNAVQVLQTASRVSTQLTMDGHASSNTGSCLKLVRTFNEESWQALIWSSGTDSSTQRLKEALASPSDQDVVAHTLFDDLTL